MTVYQRASLIGLCKPKTLLSCCHPLMNKDDCVSNMAANLQAPASSFTQGSYTDDTADPHIPSGNQKTALLKRMLRANLLSEASWETSGKQAQSHRLPDSPF